jgi:tetratricopeptide (TPR) repeat protein
MPSLQDATLRHALLYLRQLVAENDGYLAGGESMLDALAQFDRDWDPSLERLVDFCNAYPDAGAYVLSLRLPPKSRLTWLTAALKASRLLQNDLTTQAHLGNLGLTYMELGQTQTAIEYFQQALQWL